MKNNSFEWFKLDNAAKIFPGQNSRSWSNVFRIGIQLKEEIDPVVLDQALQNTLERIPSFDVRIRRGLFWFYFEKNPNMASSEPDIKNLCYRINFKENKGFLFRLYYHGKTVSADIYHALCDGYGAVVFMSTLVGEYLRLRGHEIDYGAMVLNCSDEPKKEEVEDAYSRYADSKAKYDRREKWVYHAVGTKLPTHMSNYVVGTMSFEAVHALAKQYGVTLTEFFAALLLDIHYRKQLREKKKQKEVSVQIPVNLRKAFPSETLRNFVLCLRVKLDPNLGDYTFDEILRSVSLQLRLANDPKLTNALMTENLKIERNPVAKFMPLAVKNLGVALTFWITAEKTTSTLISNIGPVCVPQSVAEHIEKYLFFTGPGKLNGARCGVITFGDRLCFTFSNCYRESDIEREFFTRLVKMGIHVKIESNRD
ncbi:MAG: hypothetical protein ACI4GB_00865 [Acutalibacteraceae bacterium]